MALTRLTSRSLAVGSLRGWLSTGRLRRVPMSLKLRSLCPLRTCLGSPGRLFWRCPDEYGTRLQEEVVVSPNHRSNLAT